MKKREIRLEDGRYLIYYTFEDEGDSSSRAVESSSDAAGSEKRGGECKCQS